MTTMSKNPRKLSPRSATFLLTLLVGVIIGSLIYFEQISVLYLLATLSLVVLLLVVAFSDLENVGFEKGD